MIAMPTVYPVTAHTKHVGPGSTFVAIQGFKENGIDFIVEALHRGATTIIVSQDVEIPAYITLSLERYDAELLHVENTRKALAELSAAAAGYPARHLTLIGFTGTKGKTTSVYLLEHLLRMHGFKTARITGISNIICGQELPSNLTTPQPDYLHQFFRVCVEHGVTHVIMEVAAQALSLHRIDTIALDAAVFTNLAREHFEFYANLEEYGAIKAAIFEHTKSDALRLCHGTDTYAASYINSTKNIHGYGFNKTDLLFNASDVMTYPHISFIYSGERITCPSLCGLYNAENLLAVVILALHYGMTITAINNALASFGTIPGRMERYIFTNNITAIIDYAHNPSSYSALLSTLRPLTDNLIVVFGASGTRDKGKRALMGAAAAAYADIVVLTSDNPGPEDPLHIIECIKSGIDTEKVHIIEEPDRTYAIQKAYNHAKPGSIIALLGKGPDEYQVIQGTKLFFSERAILQQLGGNKI